jgi:hypothetical protein
LNPADVMNLPAGMIEVMGRVVAEEARTIRREQAKARARG